MSSFNAATNLFSQMAARARDDYNRSVASYIDGQGRGLADLGRQRAETARAILQNAMQRSAIRRQQLAQIGESLGRGLEGYGKGVGVNANEAADRALKQKISDDRNATDLEVAKRNGSGGGALDPLSAQALQDASDIYMGKATPDVVARYNNAIRDPHLSGMMSRISGADLKAGAAGETALLSNLDILAAEYSDKDANAKAKAAAQQKALRLVRNHGVDNLSEGGLQTVLGTLDMMDARDLLTPAENDATAVPQPNAAPAARPSSSVVIPADASRGSQFGLAVRNAVASVPGAFANWQERMRDQYEKGRMMRSVGDAVYSTVSGDPVVRNAATEDGLAATTAIFKAAENRASPLDMALSTDAMREWYNPASDIPTALKLLRAADAGNAEAGVQLAELMKYMQPDDRAMMDQYIRGRQKMRAAASQPAAR